jgi:hypothetical protein
MSQLSPLPTNSQNLGFPWSHSNDSRQYSRDIGLPLSATRGDHQDVRTPFLDDMRRNRLVPSGLLEIDVLLTA